MYFDTNTLEFNKILTKLQSYAASNFSKEKILELKISHNSRKIAAMLDEVEEALRESVYVIVNAAKNVLEQTPPELSAVAHGDNNHADFFPLKL